MKCPHLILYRGHGLGVTDTRCTLPTFTDVIDIAKVYAETHKGTVTKAVLRLQNPLTLGDEAEDVVEIGFLTKALTQGGVAPEQIRAWAKKQTYWRFDGNWIDLTNPPSYAGDGTPYVQDHAYTDTYRVADCPTFLALATQAGYDGYIYRGTFTSGHRLKRPEDVIAAESSFDPTTASALEFRPFRKNQIKPAT